MKKVLWLAVFMLLASSASAQQFLARMAVAEDADFLKRVEFAIIKTAIAVQAEDATTCCYTGEVTEATATDAQKMSARALAAMRSRLSINVLNGSQQYARQIAKGVVTNMALTLASTDNDIEFTVNSMWNAYAKNGMP